MAGNKSAKGNPAHKRMSNPNMAARRASNWLAQQQRKDARRKEQDERTKLNKLLTAKFGGLTAHQALNAANRDFKVKSGGSWNPAVVVAHRPVYSLTKTTNKFGSVWHIDRYDGHEKVTTVDKSINRDVLVPILDQLNFTTR